MSTTRCSVDPVPARAGDLSALFALEQSLFPPERQEPLSGLKRSLASPHQELWVIREKGTISGSMTLRIYPKSLRVYSLAVARVCQGRGYGEALMKKAEARARSLGKRSLRLEADAANSRLLNWYAGQGFQLLSVLPGYYGPGTAAHRLFKIL